MIFHGVYPVGRHGATSDFSVCARTTMSDRERARGQSVAVRVQGHGNVQLHYVVVAWGRMAHGPFMAHYITFNGPMAPP